MHWFVKKIRNLDNIVRCDVIVRNAFVFLLSALTRKKHQSHSENDTSTNSKTVCLYAHLKYSYSKKHQREKKKTNLEFEWNLWFSFSLSHAWISTHPLMVSMKMNSIEMKMMNGLLDVWDWYHWSHREHNYPPLNPRNNKSMKNKKRFYVAYSKIRCINTFFNQISNGILRSNANNFSLKITLRRNIELIRIIFTLTITKDVRWWWFWSDSWLGSMTMRTCSFGIPWFCQLKFNILKIKIDLKWILSI